MLTPIRPNYDQVYLFPPVLEDWISADHPARFVRDFVASLDLISLGFSPVVPASTGRPPYDTGMLLSAWLYGYLERIRSSRQVERATFNNLGVIWLTGNLHPDHNTLSNFLRDHRTAFKKLFSQLVRVAAKLELVGMLVHALDGTKIASQCSKRGAWHRENLKKTLALLDETVETLLAQTEQADRHELGETTLPRELTDAQSRREQILSALTTLEDAQTDHLQPREAEARMIKGGDGRTVFSYNAQAVVDASSGLVVASDVVPDAADNALLPPMLDQVEATLGDTAEMSLADGGYQSGESFAKLEEQGREVLVNLESYSERAASAYTKEHFCWQPEANQYVCPHGHALPWVRRKTKKHKRDGSPYWVDIFRCGACADCPARSDCTTSKTGRSIERNEYDDAFQRQRLKQRDPDARFLLKWRGAIIERLFGQIKQGMGFRRWTVAGLEAVQAQWALICTTINLKRFIQWWRTGQLDMERMRIAFRVIAQAEIRSAR